MRFLIIQQSRPELVPKLALSIDEYEMSVIPRSLFAVDGSLLVYKGKSVLMNIIESLPKVHGSSETADVIEDLSENPLGNILPDTPPTRVLIVDAMATLQGIKKPPVMTTTKDLKQTFCVWQKGMMSSD